ncbi:alpha-amylase family glycosyl hydrolase [Burkholderiaceae bacterium UC74_6]
MRALLLLSLAFALAACGGGGGGGGASPDVPPPNDMPSVPAADVSAISAADPGSSLPAGWQHGAFMQIFVRSYADSNGDGIGDLRGLTAKLDYLKDLGVKGLWLMPIAASQDHDHGYAVANYRDVETAYGSLADLDELLRQAHARGIGVVLDYVMNHSAAQNPIFLSSRWGMGSAYRNWYVWQASVPSGWSIYGGNPWRGIPTGAYYAPFSDTMPDFNLFNADVAAWHQSNLRFWLNRGVDGFRFDAVGNLFENGASLWLDQPQNYALMQSVQNLVAGYAQRYMVCEAPDDPQGFGKTTACGGAFAFDLKDNILAAARGDATAVQKVADYYKTAPTGMAAFLSNHDSFAGTRVWNQLNGDVARYKLAAATTLLLPGTPFIYYGEEIGMAAAGTLSGDASLRTPMSWTGDATTAGFSTAAPYRALSANAGTNNVATQAADPASLLNFYKALLALRNSVPALSQGDYAQAASSGTLLQFQRSTTSGSRALVIINYGAAAATAHVTGLGSGAALQGLYPSGLAASSANASGQMDIALPAQSLLVFQVTP